jgi:hypothetical protein
MPNIKRKNKRKKEARGSSAAPKQKSLRTAPPDWLEKATLQLEKFW